MDRAPSSRPTVFVSYSHVDEAWKERLVKHLRVLELEGDLDLWEDRRIEAGDDWRPEIETALARASAAVLLVSADFLISRFIRDVEVPRLLERRAEAGVRVKALLPEEPLDLQPNTRVRITVETELARPTLKELLLAETPRAEIPVPRRRWRRTGRE